MPVSPCGQACSLAEAAWRWCPVAGGTRINNPPLPHQPCTLPFCWWPWTASPSHTHSQGWAVSATVRSAAGFRYWKHVPPEKNYKFLSAAGSCKALTDGREQQRLGTGRAGAPGWPPRGWGGGPGLAEGYEGPGRRRPSALRKHQAPRHGANGGDSGDPAGRGGKRRDEAAGPGPAGRPGQPGRGPWQTP